MESASTMRDAAVAEAQAAAREADPDPVRFLASCVPGAGLASGSPEGARRGGRR